VHRQITHNKLLDFVPATNNMSSTGLPTLSCGSPLVVRCALQVSRWVMNKEQLLSLLGSLIRVSDGELVENRSCFPCPERDREKYIVARDSIQKMVAEADISKSELFQAEIAGKSAEYSAMKARILSAPTKRAEHRSRLLNKLTDLGSVGEAGHYINAEHHGLYNELIRVLSECHDA